MKITYITNGEHSMLVIKSCLLRLLSHARVANAAICAAPGATVTTTGLFCLKTVISGDTPAIFEARAAARREEFK
ncbi:hypothetical protein QU24_02280 [Pantoea rodasii]|uniref:Uncharacterized protein n=1 Tax=Pantoea rodasii TaxID=1076549 RepID=A0A0B1R9L7_9GAMM|nr:hypothetical protein [Pantoea rodasii]KHJ69703.1 hypothetical protein QU24_02280 [Pantoea rodasii]